MRGPGSTKEEPASKKPEGKKPHSHKPRDQDLPDRLLSETRSFTQEAYSKTSTVQTITGKSTVERKEEMHTSFSHTHTFSVSSPPVEKNKRVYTLQQAKRPSQDTPPPQCPGSSDAQREEKQTLALGAHHDKVQVLHRTPIIHTLQSVYAVLTSAVESRL